MFGVDRPRDYDRLFFRIDFEFVFGNDLNFVQKYGDTTQIRTQRANMERVFLIVVKASITSKLPTYLTMLIIEMGVTARTAAVRIGEGIPAEIYLVFKAFG
jgi:hypothetical protein